MSKTNRQKTITEVYKEYYDMLSHVIDKYGRIQLSKLGPNDYNSVYSFADSCDERFDDIAINYGGIEFVHPKPLRHLVPIILTEYDKEFIDDVAMRIAPAISSKYGLSKNFRDDLTIAEQSYAFALSMFTNKQGLQSLVDKFGLNYQV